MSPITSCRTFLFSACGVVLFDSLIKETLYKNYIANFQANLPIAIKVFEAYSAGSSAVKAEQHGISVAWKFIISTRMPSGVAEIELVFAVLADLGGVAPWKRLRLLFSVDPESSLFLKWSRCV
jgi:hypothetical protein